MSINPNYYRLNSNSVILTTIAFIAAVIVTLIGKPFYAPSHLTFEVKNDQPDHYSIYVNTGFGYNEEELVGRSWYDFVAPEYLSLAAKHHMTGR